MTFNINDLTLVTMLDKIKEIVSLMATHDHDEQMQREAHQYRSTLADTLLHALPELEQLMEAATPSCNIMVPREPKLSDIWKILGDLLTPEQLGLVGRWIRKDNAPAEEPKHTEPADPEPTTAAKDGIKPLPGSGKKK